jgi:signal transduction histidine kinase
MSRSRIWWACGAVMVATVILSLSYVTIRVQSLVAVESTARMQARTDELARSALWRMDSDLMGRLTALDADVGNKTFEDTAAASAIVNSSVMTGLPTLDLWVHHANDAFQGVGMDKSTALRDRIAHTAVDQLRRMEETGVGWDPLHVQGKPLAGPTGQIQTKQGDFDQRNLQIGNSLFSNYQFQLATVGAPTFLKPVQVEGTYLLLVRARARNHVREYDFMKLDWPLIRKRLCINIQDLLPHASLVLTDQSATAEYPLASLPIALIPGPLDHDDSTTPPVMLALVAAWIAVLVAVIAMVVTLLAVLAMAERKSAFAAAVTHELRTPITSLRLYADMLTEGMVTDPIKQQEYLGTIRTESERLGTLVENVLSFARLERQRSAPEMQLLPARDLINRCQERLERRALHAGMRLEVVLPMLTEPRDEVRADPVLVEQVLSNLVDNACKYASAASDARIVMSLEVDPSAHAVRILVRDFGPGVAADVLPRLFVPFSRTTSTTSQGIGLGLALSRRIATYLHARLEYRPQGTGALFVLTFSA